MAYDYERLAGSPARAIRAAGYIRETMDIDLIVARDRENEAKVFSALSTLPDNAARELLSRRGRRLLLAGRWPGRETARGNGFGS
jgi:hypothetical protein